MNGYILTEHKTREKKMSLPLEKKARLSLSLSVMFSILAGKIAADSRRAAYAQWFEEHSLPSASEEVRRLTDEEFPAQARWESWMREEAAKYHALTVDRSSLTEHRSAEHRSTAT